MKNLSSLEDQISKIFDQAVKDTAEDVLIEIESAYEDVINQFYSHYESKRRTYSLFYGSNGYDTLFNPNTLYYENGIPIVGIDVHSSFIPGDPYRADINGKDWVFNRSFQEGIHGFTAMEAEVWSKRTHKNRYKKTSKFIKPKKIPTQMEKPPKELMDEKFKDIASKEHLDKIFNKNLAKLLKTKG